MKYCRFQFENGWLYGQVEEYEEDLWITRTFPGPRGPDLPDPSGEWDGGWGDPPLDFKPIKLSAATLFAPVRPTKIVCVGRNYRDHAKELGNEVPAEPMLFFKPISSLLSPGGTIVMPTVSQRVDFEGELAIIIAQRARGLSRDEDLRPYIHGFTLANDVTARDLQKKDGQWTRAKGFDTFCPVGPLVDTEVDLGKPLKIETHVNGELRQQGSTADFIFTLSELLEYITAVMTLEPGDLLLTGTPAGVGPLFSGDTVEVGIAGFGRLSNFVEASSV